VLRINPEKANMKRTLPALIALVLFAAPAFAQAPDITGKWDMSIVTSQGSNPVTLTVKKESDKLTGVMSSAMGEVPATVTLKEKAVSIEMAIQTPNGAMNIVMSGSVDGDTMKGTADFGGRGTGDWTAKKSAAASAPAPAPAEQAPSQEKPAATLTGTWAFEVTHAAGVSTPTVTITQTGDKLAGKYSGSYGESELTGTIKGTEFTFTVEIGTEQKVKVVYTGTLATDTVKGNVSMRL